MQLDEAIQHAIQQAQETKDTLCAIEHWQLAAWLTELKSLRASVPQPYILMSRTTQVRNEAGEWVTKPFQDLKAGDVFRCLDLGGEVADKGTPHEVCVSRGTPFLTQSMEGGVFTLGIMCDPESDSRRELGLRALMQEKLATGPGA
ncbi:MAG: hypothetical protein A2Y38_12260 [Spirochaetes bacterium GWB1_59_5]|nr:MAG: hypothetical protein A2Y38_12260 [Spirochaetes bacterium GWB1_59_5]